MSFWCNFCFLTKSSDLRLHDVFGVNIRKSNIKRLWYRRFLKILSIKHPIGYKACEDTYKDICNIAFKLRSYILNEVRQEMLYWAWYFLCTYSFNEIKFLKVQVLFFERFKKMLKNNVNIKKMTWYFLCIYSFTKIMFLTA